MSATGICFETDAWIAPGPMHLSVFLETGSELPEVMQCESHVVRVEEGSTRRRVAVQIDRIMF